MLRCFVTKTVTIIMNTLPMVENKDSITQNKFKKNTRYKFLFENSPIPIHETNVSNVMNLINELKDEKINDIKGYLASQTEILNKMFYESDIFDVNTAMLQLTEAESKAYYLANFKLILGEPCFQFFKAVVIALFKGENQLTGTTQITTFKGDKIWVEATAVFLSTGEEEMINYTFKEITGERQKDEAIKLINNRLIRGDEQENLDNLVLALAEAFDLPYVFIGQPDTANKIVDTLAFSVNQEIVENTRYQLNESPCEQIYKTQEMVIYNDYLDEVYPTHEVIQSCKGKSYLGFPLFSKKGKVIGHFSFISKKSTQDMSALKSVMGLYAAWASTELMHIIAQNNLTLKNETIQSQLEELNEKNQELERYFESNSQLENFAYIASHDLKAPIRTIVSFSQLLKRKLEGSIDEESKEYLDFVISGSRNMRDLIDDLLDYSKVNSQENDVNEVDTDGLLSAITSEIQVSIQENNAIVNWEKLPTIDGDLIKLKQLFQNLITNAIKFQRPDINPVVQIKSKETKTHWQFSVTDNGIGIKAAYFDDIFKLFKKLHSNESFDGTGLGLAICRKIVEQHEGEIWVASEFGKGTTFYFTLKKS